MIKDDLESYLNSLPAQPGIYLFKNSAGEVLYVGKASNLRNRVKSYFKQVANLPEKISQLAKNVSKIDFIITESEIAALVLECQQIKKYRPHYNILLKDDKSFPYIKVNVKNEWPSISISRKRYNDGARYIGRIPSAWSARQTVELVKNIFLLRTCTKNITGNEARPCLKYHIHRCSGPCIGAIKWEQYQDAVRKAIAFLEGREDQVLRQLKINMKDASNRMEFERAAILRDQIQSIESVIASHKIPFNIRGEVDVIGLARNSDVACIKFFSIKDSRIAVDEHFIIEHIRHEKDADIIEQFIKLFYSSTDYIPETILIQHPLNETQLIEDWLRAKRGASVKLRVPVKGAGRRLLDMTAANAVHQLGFYQAKTAGRPENTVVLTNLQKRLGLPKIPYRIEGYDISNIQGTLAVGSMVVFENGIPRPQHYRRFKIKTITHPDDYAMIKEIIYRRFKGHTDSDQTWPVPDLVVIDGGKGQLSSASAALKESGVTDIPLISIAKEYEDIYLPEKTKPVRLDKTSDELHLLQHIRDEAHRFAITYHRKLRDKKTAESQIDTIPGIGPARKRALIKKFGSVKNIRNASVEDLTAIKGITPKLASLILQNLQ